VNRDHRIACASPDWAQFLEEVVVPCARAGVELGDDLAVRLTAAGFTGVTVDANAERWCTT
jgi:hypothetical protein